MEESQQSALLIIGNGFDLTCGLQTKYTDFFDYEMKHNNDFKTFHDQLQNINMFHFDNWGGNPIGEVKKMQNISQNLTVWDMMFQICEVYPFSGDTIPSRWCDIESMISESLKSINIESDFLWLGVFNFLDHLLEYGHMVNSLLLGAGRREMIIGYLIFVSPIFRNQMNQNRTFTIHTFFSFLFSQLKIFEARFAQYILHVQESNGLYQNNAEDLLIKLSSGIKDFYVESFNYTTIEFCKNKLLNIHGCARESGIVAFGVFRRDISSESPVFQFTKASRQCELLANNIRPIKKDKNIGKVIVFGHSLNEQDYSYFFQLFDFIELANVSLSKPDLSFAYSVYDLAKSSEIINTYTKAVSSIIDAYGKSKNISNLLSVLVNGGRLDITKIS